MPKKQDKASEPTQTTTPKIPTRWGTSEAKWFADHEGEHVFVHLHGEHTVEGILVGVDQYAIFVEQTDGEIIPVFKHAIDIISKNP